MRSLSSVHSRMSRRYVYDLAVTLDGVVDLHAGASMRPNRQRRTETTFGNTRKAAAGSQLAPARRLLADLTLQQVSVFDGLREAA